jgi:hypothetical protein
MGQSGRQSPVFKHGGVYPGDVPWDFLQELPTTAKLSPRTERVNSLNASMRGFLTELDTEYRQKQKAWSEQKRVLERKKAELEALCHGARFFLKKAMVKNHSHLSHELIMTCWNCWNRLRMKSASVRRAGNGTSWVFKHSMRPFMKRCFNALVHNMRSFKLRLRIFKLESSRSILMPHAQMAQVLKLWRCGIFVARVQQKSDVVSDVEAMALSSLQDYPTHIPEESADPAVNEQRKEMLLKKNTLDLKQRHFKAYISPARGSNAVFLKGVFLQVLRKRVFTRKARERFSQESRRVRDWTMMTRIFSRWHLYRYRSQEAGRRIMNFVLKVDKKFVRRHFSNWSSNVMFALVERHWKTELDHRLGLFEQQKAVYEQQVEALEEQLPRYVPEFGKNIPNRAKPKRALSRDAREGR